MKSSIYEMKGNFCHILVNKIGYLYKTFFFILIKVWNTSLLKYLNFLQKKNSLNFLCQIK